MKDRIIKIENLIHVYKGNVETIALKGVNLEVNKKDFMLVTGKSGTGKTTLLHCIAGMIKPTAGHIYYNDEDIVQYSDELLTEYRRKKIGIVYQSLNLIDWLTVEENIEVPMIIANKKKVERKKRVEELLEYFDIKRYKKQFPSFLSGGEQQRVAVAVALANNPEIILADEPTGNLDIENARNVYELFKQLNKDSGVTIILATHDLNATMYANAKYDLTDYKEIREKTE
ncbi:MAG: ABC transporter ATP-binding protein [Candidatus Heimdallarchaeaceae archaeon]